MSTFYENFYPNLNFEASEKPNEALESEILIFLGIELLQSWFYRECLQLLVCGVFGFLIDTKVHPYVFMKPKDCCTSAVVVLLLLSMQ